MTRTVRFFISSTFRDFGFERDLLVKKVFPSLRNRLKGRLVEIVDVDLRWGITEAEAERGEVLPICLAEIDRARPYFIGMLGERYGWIPPPDSYASDLLEYRPWLKKYQGGKSVTELEVLHGVLNNRRMQGRAFFYFRSPAYARAKGGDYLPSPEDRARQTELKRRIRERGLLVTSYANPEALAKRIERDLWKLLDAEFPATSVPDVFERERLRHEAYAAPRRRLYLGGERYQAALAKLLADEEPLIVIEGTSGGGKSALLANFFEAYRKHRRRHLVHEHYLGASADAADPHALVRRLIEFIQRASGSTEEIPGDPQKLMDSLPIWLATASAWALKRRTRFIFVLDSLNSLTDLQDLRWWPAFMPKGISMLVSCLPGPVHDALKGKTEALTGQVKPPKWKTVTVRPLTQAQSAMLLNTYLARFNKKLPRQMVKQIQAHPLATNPLFLRTLAEELRLFGVHEELQTRLGHYLTSQTIGDLFERVLERVEKDCGKREVKAAMTAIWGSRAGLTEKEILCIAYLTTSEWATIRYALDQALVDAGGRIIMSHDYVRCAVRGRYLDSKNAQLGLHRWLAKWFRGGAAVRRRAEEEPWQWQRAGAWTELARCLSDWPLFEALVTGLGQQELLDYWLKLEMHTGKSMAKTYQRAWRNWEVRLNGVEWLRAASALQVVLEYSGHHRGFVEKMARDAVARSSEILGAEHSETIKSVQNLASLLSATGEPKLLSEASRLSESVVRQWRRRGRRRQLASALNLFGSVRASLGDFAAAQKAYMEALEYFRLLDGPDDPFSTAAMLNNLGDLAHGNGDFRVAEDMLRQCMTIRSVRLPDGHPLIGTTLDNLAKVLAGQGRIVDSAALYAKALDIRLRALGPNHPDTNNSRVNWATMLYAAENFMEAAALFRQAASADSLRFGPLHEFTLMDQASLLTSLIKAIDLLDPPESITVRREVEALVAYLARIVRDSSVELHNHVRVRLGRAVSEFAPNTSTN